MESQQTARPSAQQSGPQIVSLDRQTHSLPFQNCDPGHRGAGVGAAAGLRAALDERAALPVATSAVRDAWNREEFLDRVKSETGMEVEILSGEEEARRTMLGILRSSHRYPEPQSRTVCLNGYQI